MQRNKDNSIIVPIEKIDLQANLVIPDGAEGIVIFAHGSGSSRKSPRNQFVAHELNKNSLATVLIDLLTAEEEASDAMTGHLRFNISFLADRLRSITRWLLKQPEISGLNLGYFGASTGAAAALEAAASDHSSIKAIVSRGGRPDMAMQFLPQIKAATLLIVGERDEEVIQLNKKAYQHLNCEKKLILVPKATHLFEEPGTLEQVARHAKDWFLRFLSQSK